MMNPKQINLFNSVFETELRIIALLAIKPKIHYTSDRIFALDFITCYAETFHYEYKNLHGNNKLMFGELSNRRLLIKEALKDLVVKGLVDVIVEKEFEYYVNDSGLQYISKFESDYYIDYSTAAEEIIDKCSKLSDLDLISIIELRSIYALKEG